MIEFYKDEKLKAGPEDDKTAEELKAELEGFKVQSALAQAEIYEKQEQDKLLVMSAIAEAYELGLSGGIE